MRYAFTRFTGLILVLTALIGMVASLAALVWLQAELPNIETVLQSNVREVQSTLQTTADGLVIVESSLGSSISSFTTLEATVEATALSINDTTPMIETMILLAREDLPSAIDSAQLSLIAAKDSAEIIDGLLSFLAGLPLVPRNLYNPPVPLHVALGQVSESLENIPGALETIDDSLTTTTTNIETIQTEISLIAEDLNEINLSLVEAQGVIADYQTSVASLQERVTRLDSGIPRWMAMFSTILTFLLIWVAISQIGLLLQGIALLSIPRPITEPEIFPE